MSKQNLERKFKKELEVLNYIIDQKILKGLPYSKEARRHKVILESLVGLKKSQSAHYNWISKPLRFASTFIF